MNESTLLKRFSIVLLIILVAGGIKGVSLYHRAFSANVSIKSQEGKHIYIPSGINYEGVVDQILKTGVIRNERTFRWTAKKKNLESHIHPGRYLIKNRMSNNELVNMLRSGRQDPVTITMHNLRTTKQLANSVSQNLEFKADSLYNLLSNIEFLKTFGFDRFSVMAMFIPNSYEFFWDTSAEEFVNRMYDEYNAFWNGRRGRKAERLELSKIEVITLASIVNEETRKENERPTVAGVYMNRLQKGMKLQADPTVIFALNDFNVRRVLRKHYFIDSPYNTYKYYGLPPGPICMPDISSIDAVLNYNHHDYLYFCAKPDFSGYHNFAKTLAQHNKNARLYRRELNRRRIYN
jgi:UPF0755 protein